MIINAVDERKDLFVVTDVVSSHLIDQFNAEDINAYEYTFQEWQQHLPRRKLIPYKESALQSIFNEVENHRDQINQTLNTEFFTVACTCWHDFEGLHQDLHVDNPGVKGAMQFYIGQADTDHGTTFYQASDSDILEVNDSQKWHIQNFNLPVRHECQFITNTGYIMLNHKTQVHAPSVIVRSKQKRVSIYCHLW